MAALTWYFDFVSPFSYIQFAAYPDLVRRADVTLKPVLFAGLLAHWGHKGPAELPTKRRHTYRHCVWDAARRGVPFRFPPAHPFNPLHALRLAIARGADYDTVREIFEFVWREGRSPADEWRALCERLGVADADALTGDPSVKAALRANVDEAIAAGVFGVPTFVVDGELFWGVDATPMLLDYLADPGLFRSEAMRRVDALPVAAERKG
ncbi:MAG: 2-hydroxychromene-2-carboxylate isomerase [Burkholderiales bacterium]|jgi:2-hydroxychromene-2-carboxylate isomerase|nr:2-hydroxychromene-2-carboxylate isomerase [Burkholderiales bacterium]